MENKTKLKDNEFVFESKLVRCNNDTTLNIYKYDNISCEDVEKLNPELHLKIEKEVLKFQTNKVKVIRQREEEKKRKKYQEKLICHNKFKVDIEKYIPEGYETSYRFHKDNLGYTNNVDINKIGIGTYFTIEYSNSVYSAGSWHSHKTNRPWVVNMNYKDIRYSLLKTAVEKGIERLNKKIESDTRQKNNENKKEFQVNELKKFSEKNGFKFKKVWKSSRYDKGYYSYYAVKDNVKCQIVYSEENNKPCIISIIKSEKQFDFNEVN